MATRKIINIYKARKDNKGVLPTGESDENYEKLNFSSKNFTDSKNVKYDNTTSKLQATNIQSAIDELQSNQNIIRDEQEHYAGYYDNGKPVYYRAYNRNLTANTTIDISSWYTDSFIMDYAMRAGDAGRIDYLLNYGALANQGFYLVIENNSIKVLPGGALNNTSWRLYRPVFYYTKTTDSRIL